MWESPVCGSSSDAEAESWAHSLQGGPESLKALGVLASGVGVTW